LLTKCRVPSGIIFLYAWRHCNGPAAETCSDPISLFIGRKAACTWTRTRPQNGAVTLTAAQASQLVPASSARY
jgi:hypothetical protein